MRAVEISYGAISVTGEASESAQSRGRCGSAAQENLAKAFEEHKQLHEHWKAKVH